MGYLDGFGVVVRKWVGVTSDTGRRVTLQYPEQTRPKPERFHGRHVLNRYEDGMEKCIGCELCAGVCPAQCIYVRGKDNDPAAPTSPGERFGFVYEINYLRCIHCDLCVEACPTEAITESKLFEFAFTNRDDAIYTKAELVVDDEGRPQQLPWENWDGGFDAAKDTSGWMRATAPSGDADFVGLVAWAGELGYGVRAPEGGVLPAEPLPDAFAEPEPEPTPEGSGGAAGAEVGRGVFDAATLAGPAGQVTDAPSRPDAAGGAFDAATTPFEAVDEDTDVAQVESGDAPWSPTSDRGAFDAPAGAGASATADPSVDELIPMEDVALGAELDDDAAAEPAEAPWSPTSDRGAFDAPEGAGGEPSVDELIPMDAAPEDAAVEESPVEPEDAPWSPLSDGGKFDLGDVDPAVLEAALRQREEEAAEAAAKAAAEEAAAVAAAEEAARAAAESAEAARPAPPTRQRGTFDIEELEPEPEEQPKRGRGFGRRRKKDDEGGSRR